MKKNIVRGLKYSMGQQCRFALTMMALLWASTVLAGSSWFTARTVNGQTRPLSAGIADPPVIGDSKSTVQITNGLIDLSMSLYNDPPGDGDGSTQGSPGSMQDHYERMVQYFADAVYEATEGTHQIRKVRIFRNGRRQDADVIWTASGHPVTRMQCRWVPFHYVRKSFIEMFDNFSSHHFLSSTNDNEDGGYVLAHEWGHYCYQLFDEYCVWNGSDWQDIDQANAVKPSIMNNQWQARRRNYQWLNYSIAWQGHTPAACNPFENTRISTQHQVYDKSAWETLNSDPSTDPDSTSYQSRFRRIYGTRPFYPELVSVAPTGTNPPRIDLSSTTPLTNLPSRSALTIVWMSTNDVAVQVVIDRSASMYGEPLENVRSAAKCLVDNIQYGSYIGVLAFCDTVSTTYPLTRITSDDQKDDIKSEIDNIVTGPWTAMGDAAAEALNGLNSGTYSNMVRTVFLLTDGDYNWGIDPRSVITNYQNAQVPIMGFVYGDYTDPVGYLRQMVTETGGKYFRNLSSYSSVANAFMDAQLITEARQRLAYGVVTPAAYAVKSPDNVNVSFNVDVTLTDLRMNVSYAAGNTVTLTLVAPNGVSYSAISTNTSGAETLQRFSVSTPIAGTWRLTGTAPAGLSLVYRAEAGVKEFTYNLDTVTYTNTIDFPNPIYIWAYLNKVQPINGAVVSAVVTAPDGSQSTLSLSNSSPGEYSGYYMPSNNGTYIMTVTADNSAGTARITYQGGLPACEEGGYIPPMPSDEPFSNNFSRAVTFDVTVINVPASLMPPDAPAYITASFGNYSDIVRLNWSAANNAQAYEVWRNTESNSAGADKLAEVPQLTTNYDDTAVSVGVIYYYWVKAKNYAGNSALGGGVRGRLQYSTVLAADFDGDRKADPTVVDNNGNWYVWLSGQGYQKVGPYPFTVGAPAAADFDGDGAADPAVYVNGDWYAWLSSWGYRQFGPYNHGHAGAAPVVADFDGDGVADLAVYGSANWYAWLSTLGYQPKLGPYALGYVGGTATAADFDGDRVADPVIFVSGSLYIYLSSINYQSVGPYNLGLTGAVPVAADFDGDGLGDLALVEGNNWYVWFSSYGYNRLGPYPLNY